MCSVTEDDFGDEGGAHSMVEDPKINGFDGELCKKCHIEACQIKLDFKESMCMTCFLVYVRHKFRATLGSTKIVRRGSKVLLHFTGNAENVCLLDMIKYAFEQESHKRLAFDLELAYIDEHLVDMDGGHDPVKRLRMIQGVTAVLEQFPNFRCYYTTIGGATIELPLISSLSISDVQTVIEREKKFLAIFNSLQSLSSKQDLLATTRSNVLREAATALECQYVFISDISITMATRLLTNISLGRGSSAALDVAFCDDRIEALKFVRPFKDLNPVEVTSYIKFTNLKVLEDKSYGCDHGNFASIQNLTSKFINDLQQNFSSTVSTVYRTCSKIAPVDKASPIDGDIPQCLKNDLNFVDMNQRCVMCKSFLDYENSETLFATEFSRLVAESAGSEDHVKNIDEIERKVHKNVEGGNCRVKKHLCHGCRNIFIGLNDENLDELL